MPVAMRGPNGDTIAADEAKIHFWINQGYTPLTEQAIGAEIQADAFRPEDRGLAGDVNAAVASALGGATLGASDVLLSSMLDKGDRRRLAGDIQHAPVLSTAARLTGELAPALLSGGSSLTARALAKTPAGMLGRASIGAAEALPVGTGLVSRTARIATAGAIEGSVSNAGQYLGAMALQDKEASAEGLIASLVDGALWGGGAAGALGIAGEGLIAARRLIPTSELTPLAARRARDVAVQEVSRAVDDTRELVDVGRAKARQIREEWIAGDIARRAELDKIAIQKAQALADEQVATARAKTAKAEAQAQAARARAEKAAQPRAGRKRKADAEPAPEPTDLDADIRRAIQAGEIPDEVGPFTPYGLDLAVEREMLRRGVNPPEPDTDLFRQLKQTQAKIEGGESLSSLSARQKDDLVEDALNARVAEESPEMARLLKHLNGLSDARVQVAAWLDKYPKSKVRSVEFTEGMRKQEGWAEVVPQGEGDALLPRGRQGEWRGGDRDAFERKVERKDLYRRIDDPVATPDEKAAAQARLDEMDAQRTARQVVEAGADEIPATVDKHVEKALEGEAGILDDEIDDATEAIGSLEQRTADLADELGDEAPVMVRDRARQYRETQRSSETSADQAQADAVADAERAAKMIATGAAPARPTGLLARAEHAGQMLEALELLGVPVPNVSRLPVVGPLLSMYLKAKLAFRAVKGLGGKVPRTAETEIARRANDTKSRLLRAADHALANTGRRLTALPTARAAGALSVKLFSDGDEKREKKTDDLETLYLARRDELTRAMAPGAIREAVRRRVRTADAELIDAITAVEERKLKFLYEKMPHAESGLQILGRRSVRSPSRIDIEQWAKYVHAANRPAETLEALLSGDLVSAEAAETVRTLIPRLVQDVQMRIVERAIEDGAEIPFRRRIHLSTVLGIPLDDSQGPEAAAFLAGLYVPRPGVNQQPMPQSTMVATIAERVDPETRM